MYNKIIPYGKQEITEDDVQAVVSALKSDYLTQGPQILEFEKQFANYVGSKFAVSVANGTAALHLSVLALGLSKGDKVITTPITFAASANCVRYCDGEVVFTDIDPETYLIDIEKLTSLLEQAPLGTYKGIIPVNFAGSAVNLEKLKHVANEYGLWILEDSCHSPGGYFIDSKGTVQNCGNGAFADLAIFSFHPVKHIACGEGGMITTNDKYLYEKLLALRTHGIVKLNNQFTNCIKLSGGIEEYPGWYMEMQTLGYNYRLTEFQAALGKSQLKRANENILKRKGIARKYDLAFNSKKFIIRHSGLIDGHAYHLYIIEIKHRLELYNYLRSKNIFTQIHYFPCHLMPYYRNLGWKEGDLVNAENYYSNCISLPIYPTLTEEEQDYVVSSIINFFSTKEI
jgi:UDP-4-amino-4,6-dideoxy-N-acetyl-beta-L-altrosamine transaminase